MFRRKPEDNAVSLAQSAMCCARVKDLLQRSVRELQQYQAGHGFPEITSLLAHANDVCTSLEAVFLHNFRAPFTAKMTSSLARLGRRQSMERLPETSYWPYVTLYTPRDFVEQLSKLENITSEVGQCRAWVRLALNHNLMYSYIEAILADPDVMSSWYSEGAFLLDATCAGLMRSLVQGLCACDFNLTYDSASLNAWTRQTMQLVGMYSPTSASQQDAEGATATSSRTSSGEMSPSRSDCGDTGVVKSKSQAAIQISVNHEGQLDAVSSLPSSVEGSVLSQSPLDQASTLASDFAIPPDSKAQLSTVGGNVSSPSSLATSSNKPLGDSHLPLDSRIRVGGKSKSASLSQGRSAEATSATMAEGSVQRLKDEYLQREDVKGAGKQRSAVSAASATSGQPSSVSTPVTSTMAQSVVTTRSPPDVPVPEGDSANSLKSKKSRIVRGKKESSKTKRSKKAKAGSRSESLAKTGLLGNEIPDDGQMGLILKIANEHGLESQTYQCHACMRPIGVLFGAAKVCAYDGRYYCNECHLDEEEVIPARLAHNWDFHKYKVCKSNLEVLHFMEEQPVIDLASTNPSLYSHVPELLDAKLLRSRLRALYTYVSTCKNRKILQEFQNRLPREHLVQCNEHIYSVQDLLQVQSGVLVQALKKLVVFASKHVHECRVCRLKGFICEICKDEDVIFAFDVASCTQCAHCLAVFHRSCKEAVPCPKCQRLALRQQRMLSRSDDSDE